MNFDKTKKEIIRAGVHTYIEIRKAAAEEILKDFNPSKFSINTWCEIRALVEEKKRKFGVE